MDKNLILCNRNEKYKFEGSIAEYPENLTYFGEKTIYNILNTIYRLSDAACRSYLELILIGLAESVNKVKDILTKK